MVIHRVALIAVILGTLAAGGSVKAQTSTPQTLMHRSAIAMMLLRQVHSQGTQTDSLGSRIHITGDCDATPPRDQASLIPRALKTEYRLQGPQVRAVRNGATRVQNVNAHYIVIGSDTSMTGWEQSPRTHDQWKEVFSGALQSDPMLKFVCPIFFAPGFARGHLQFTDRGSVTVQGTSTRHLRSTQTRVDPYRYDVFIEPSSLLWLRFGMWVRLGWPIATQRTRVAYSRFNQPVHISAPISSK